MACCKAKEYKWCKKLDTVYTDEESKEYCVFHAPKGTEGVANIEEFNELIFTRILEARNSNGICDLSGTIFGKAIDFGQFCDKRCLSAINLSHTIFNDRVNFSGIIIKGDVNFKHVTFTGHANFSFNTFNGNAYFKRANFNGIADFRNSKFKNKADFMFAKFIDNADFGGAVFNGTVDFSSKMNSWRTIINQDLNLSSILIPRIDPQKTFTRMANFKMTTFMKETNFMGCSSNDIIRFEEVDLAHVLFLETNLREFNFVRCTWQQKFGRNVLYDEIIATSQNRSKSFEQVEDLYRQLKQKYKKEHNEPETSNWHFGEKEMYNTPQNLDSVLRWICKVN